MTAKFLSVDQFREQARRGDALGDVAVLREGPGFSESKFSDDGVGPWAVLTTRQVDHSLDTIEPAGWDLSAVRSNFPVLVNHRPDMLVGQWTDTKIQPDRVIARPRLAKGFDLASTCRALIEQNILKGVSVGFRPTKWRMSEDPARRGGIDFLQQVMIEASLTPTPANPGALLLMEAKGIDVRPLRRLERGSPMTREERIRHAAMWKTYVNLFEVKSMTDDQRMAYARRKHEF